MDPRLEQLFKHTVDEYIASGEPVGSSALVERYRLDVSPATVRNWFAELDDAGLLTQAHTSGGRLPTERGFALYVEHFVEPRPAGKRDRELLHRATQGSDKVRGLKLVSRALAELSGLASFVAFTGHDTFYTGLSQLFAHPEFKSWQQVLSLTDVLDHLDETLSHLGRETYRAPTVRLGDACPFGAMCGAVLLSTPIGLIGLLGPIRMDYQRAVSLLTTLHDLIQP